MSGDLFTPRGRSLERAVSADVAAIVALETHPSMTSYIGSWTAERHTRQLDDDEHRYYVLRDGTGGIDGFAIVVAFNAKFRWYEIARIVVREPGEGRGSDLLHGVLDATFATQNAHRIQLDCYEDNHRARRAYARAGFREEGVMREAVSRDGVWISLVLLGLLESERTAPGSAVGFTAKCARADAPEFAGPIDDIALADYRVESVPG